MTSKAFELIPDMEIIEILSDALKSLKPSVFQQRPEIAAVQTRRNPTAAQNMPEPSAAQEKLEISIAQQNLISCCDTEGVVVGKLTFLLDDGLIDCEKSAVALSPLNAEKVDAMQSNGALFILLVAHFDEFEILSEEKFFERFPCILFKAHEKELPNELYISFLNRMKVELDLPVLALVNCDPFGLQILSRYDVDAWLGFRHSDLELHDVSPDRMTYGEVKIVKGLIKHFKKTHPDWVSELVDMVTYKEKADICTLRYRGIFYLPEVYLPLKLLSKDWI